MQEGPKTFLTIYVCLHVNASVEDYPNDGG